MMDRYEWQRLQEFQRLSSTYTALELDYTKLYRNLKTKAKALEFGESRKDINDLTTALMRKQDIQSLFDMQKYLKSMIENKLRTKESLQRAFHDILALRHDIHTKVAKISELQESDSIDNEFFHSYIFELEICAKKRAVFLIKISD